MSLCITQPPPLGAPAACAATAQGQEHVLHHGLKQQQQYQKATARRRRRCQVNGPRGRDCKGPSGGVIEGSCVADYFFFFHKFICIALIKKIECGDKKKNKQHVVLKALLPSKK